MMSRAPYVSVVDPIGPAIERVKMILFRPFSLERWIVIGFCAWLTHMFEGGGGGSGGMPDSSGRGHPGVQQSMDQAREWLTANMYWIIPVAVIIVVAVIAFILVITWLKSRGQFMFLYCVAQNKAEVKNPWHQFRRHGNSLFAFQIVFGIIVSLVTLTFIGLGVAAFFMARDGSGLNAVTVSVMTGCALLFVVAMIVAAIIGKFTRDFVVPIMYLRTPSAVAAWRILLDILGFNKGRFVLYILFQIIISIAIGSIVIATMCLTCGCACCLLAIPFVGTVLMLPIYVFQRSYSLFYLAQYGPEFNAFAFASQAIPPAAPPVP